MRSYQVPNKDLAAVNTNSIINLLGSLNFLKGKSVGFHPCLVGKEVCGQMFWGALGPKA